MKRFGIFLLVFAVLFSSCEKNDDSDPCNDSKWGTHQYPTIRTALLSWPTTTVVVPEESDHFTLRFRVFKTYCDGEVTGDFYSTQNFDREELIMATEGGAVLTASDGMVYTYRIENDEDKITIQARLETYPIGLEPVTYRLQKIITGRDLNLIYSRYEDNGNHLITMPFEGTENGLLFTVLLSYTD